MTKKFFNLRFGIESAQNAVGGAYLAPRREGQPHCALCDRPMVPFLQFEVPLAAELPFVAGSRLAVLMCPEHNEIPSFDSFEALPPSFWQRTDGHWYAMLSRPQQMNSIGAPAYLEPAELVLANEPDDRNRRISVGGEPEWLQAPEKFTCACGAPMAFVCQVSDGFEFPKAADAPEQPDSPSAKAYVLFLGNEVYVFACPEQCNPRAVWVTVQN